MPTLAVITTPHWNDLVALGALVVVVFALCHLARRLIDLAIEAMQRASRRLMRRRPELLDEYADFKHDPADDTEALADSLRYPDLDEDQVSNEAYGNHAAVPSATVVETTGFIPRMNQFPVDDEAALRVVRSLSPDGAR